MRYEVVYTDYAKNDLRCIFEYLAQELATPDIGTKTVNCIMDRIEELDQFPYRYPLCEPPIN